jgi:hypothetical protein
MTSIGVRTRQVSSDSGYYIPLADIRNTLFSAPSTANGALGVCPPWASTPNADRVLCLISSAGAGLLKDMGKTIVSSTRVFRKVQLVVPSSLNGQVNLQVLSTGGVGGGSGTSLPSMDYYTAYIELGSEGSGNPTRVALFGR